MCGEENNRVAIGVELEPIADIGIVVQRAPCCDDECAPCDGEVAGEEEEVFQRENVVNAGVALRRAVEHYLSWDIGEPVPQQYEVADLDVRDVQFDKPTSGMAASDKLTLV